MQTRKVSNLLMSKRSLILLVSKSPVNGVVVDNLGSRSNFIEMILYDKEKIFQEYIGALFALTPGQESTFGGLESNQENLIKTLVRTCRMSHAHILSGYFKK